MEDGSREPLNDVQQYRFDVAHIQMGYPVSLADTIARFPSHLLDLHDLQRLIWQGADLHTALHCCWPLESDPPARWTDDELYVMVELEAEG